MSRQELREQLARLAEDAPVASVPDDTYRRGRRATTRTRLVTAAVAAGALGIFAIVGLQAFRTSPSVIDGTSASGPAAISPGIPDQIWAYTTDAAPTAELNMFAPFPVAAVAYTVPDLSADHDFISDVVLVSPDGKYARFRFPDHDYAGLLGSDDPNVALSPDGTKVAWYFRDSSAHPTGISVMDLGNGTVKSVHLGRAPGTYVQSIIWSPDSGTLLWYGLPFVQWSTGRATYASHHVGGMLETGPAILRRLPGPSLSDSRWARVQVCNGGRWSVISELVERSTCSPDMHQRHRGGQLVTPLGRTASGIVATLQHQAQSWDHSEIVVNDDPVSRVDDRGINSITVATALIGTERPSHPTPRPDWASPSHRSTELVALGVVVVVGVAGWRWRARRRRFTHM